MIKAAHRWLGEKAVDMKSPNKQMIKQIIDKMRGTQVGEITEEEFTYIVNSVFEDAESPKKRRTR